MPQSSPSPATSSAIKVASLNQNAPRPFALSPDSATRAAIARELGFDAVRKLRFDGQLRARGKRDWVLTGTLGATIVQPCVITLDPVVTRIDVPVTRVYLARWEDVAEAGAETEMPEDDTLEPLGSEIDPGAVMIEALAIAAPDFPRTDPEASLGSVNVTEPGKAALTDEDVKPFAGLAALRDKLSGPEQN